MSQGTILRVSPAGKILERIPTWPFPAPGAYPQTLPSGNSLQFFPKPYWNFPLNAVLTEVLNSQRRIR